MYGYKLGLKKVGESIPAAPVNVVQPLLSGNAAVGTVVTCSNGSWTGSPSPTFSFDFKINGVSVQSGASNTFTPTSINEGSTLTVTVTATNSQGSANANSSNSLVVGSVPVNTIAPVISGTNTFGSTLTTTDGTFTGTAPITITYQWQRNGLAIAGQTANTYVVGVSDSLAAITCLVTGTNGYGSDSEVSNTITVVDFAPVNMVAPTVSPSGTQSTGTLITANDGTWVGVAPITFEYKWTRDGIAISGATASTYTIQLADDGTTIRVEVKGTNAYGASAFIASSNSVSAVNTVAPTNSVAPVISGTAVVGQVLTTTDGTWDGIPTPTYSYQWKRGATNIGTNSSTYTLVQADAGNTSNITCVVTATNAGGSANATSNQIARILDTLTNTYITGLTLTSAEIDSFNTLYLALRSNNFHTELDTLQIYSNATSAASTKPLIGSQTVILVNSPTFTRKTGYTMTGTSYIDTGFAQTGSTKFQINNNCFGFGVANKNTTSGVTGFNNGNITWVVLASNVSCGNQNSGTQGASLFTRTISNQDYATRRNNNANRNGFQDGTELNGTLASTSPTINTRTMFVGAANNAGTTLGIYESGSVVKYLYTGSYNIDPAIMRTIINNFIASL